MLANAYVATRLPAKDLERARRFYSERLGLEPVEERPEGLRYQCRGGSFALFDSAGSAAGTHTQMGWGGQRHRGHSRRAQSTWSGVRRIRCARPQDHKRRGRHRRELSKQGCR
jgi:catechol 2,3-dioxygenase-like lactoylglutathione lyase family enzyme